MAASGKLAPAIVRPTPTPISSQFMSANSPAPAAGELQILHRDTALLVVSKPAGLLAVPGRGPEKQDCLSRRLQTEFPDALIVHRLDMHTSGVIALARGKEMQRRLSGLFAGRQVDKHYLAVVTGRLAASSGEIDLPLAADWPRRPLQKVDRLAGKSALTRYRVLGHDPLTDRSRVALTAITGRTHQLRVHLLAIGHPIVGDPLYGANRPSQADTRLLLHAEGLSFAHPESGQPMHFFSPAPF